MNAHVADRTWFPSLDAFSRDPITSSDRTAVPPGHIASGKPDGATIVHEGWSRKASDEIADWERRSGLARSTFPVRREERKRAGAPIR